MSVLSEILQDSSVDTPYVVSFTATVEGSGNTGHAFVIVTGNGWILEAGAADIILGAIRDLQTDSVISDLSITKYVEDQSDITSSGD